MDNRRNSDRNQRPDHQPIDYWENIRSVLERERDVGRKHMSLRIGMQRPVFMDGKMGYYRLNTFIKVDGHYLQLSTSALAALANYFYYNRERIVSAIDEVRNRNAKIDQILDEQEAGSDAESNRFDGLENEPSDDDSDDPDDDGPKDEDDDYEEVVIVNEEATQEAPESVQPGSDAQPRRTRRNKD